MVTDEILCAVQGMIELFPTPEARNAGKSIWNMLADFEEEYWYETVNSGTVREWLQHYSQLPRPMADALEVGACKSSS